MQSQKKQWKLLHNLNNALFTQKEPVQITHFVTERCNAHCPHCFVETSAQKKELSLEEIEEISKTCGSSLRNIALTGGEPFIRDDLFEIADIWYKNSTIKTVSLCTNGSMPDKTEDFVSKAVKKNLPVSFFFSYDFTEEKHSEYRNIKDLHLKVLESYKAVNQYFPKFNATFNITLSKENYKSAYETYKFIRDVLIVQNINCTLVRGKNAELLTQEEKNEIASVYRQIQTVLDDDFDNSRISAYPNNSLTNIVLNTKNKIIWKYVLKTFEQNKYLSPCCAGALFGVIFSSGNVFPCELLNSQIGNLKDFGYNYMNLWKSEQAEAIRNNIVNSKCFCTFECIWLLNIFSQPKYYAEILYHAIRSTRHHT
ncbi:MAG: radical SAM protein [Candidatus Gastranaerophilales bacterium]|nr:radical SAM protein [Candidatus Gastranaerophilales bacterium]